MKADKRLGWLHLASEPPLSLDEINKHAEAIRAEGLEAVVLIGQGGSSQASMTVTKLHEVASNRHCLAGSDPTSAAGNVHSDIPHCYTGSPLPSYLATPPFCSGQAIGPFQIPPQTNVAFRTMDSLSPVFVNHILGSSDPAKTLYIVSSKSGTTIEIRMLERVVWHYVAGHLGEAACGDRFVAITDPDSDLQQLAEKKGYRLVLPGLSDVGGRFSALSVFALFPAALVGIDISEALANSAETEAFCCSDDPNNPALCLAAFLHASYLEGRDKFSLVMPPSGQVFGLWVEQLIAESLGKQGKGIVPNVEVDASILAQPHADRSVITFAVGHVAGFAESIANIDDTIPLLHYTLDDPEQAFTHFVVWEYATAFLGILMGVFPFDQPDVELTKLIVRDLLDADSHNDDGDGYIQLDIPEPQILELRLSKALALAGYVNGFDPDSLDSLLRKLLCSIKAGDYFSLNAFVPFRGYGRREALERMRNRVASRLDAVSCLEIGPRYLHSTGQLHKGGPDTGVFLIISANEIDDVQIPGEKFNLGDLAAVQARADFTALASCGRRALHVHLVNNDSEILSQFADRLCSAISAVSLSCRQ
ncbi:MAG: hypothetical protein LBH87_00640 [Coriobacteriales bacterium]|nr:hypothetical protein [Coriobacteriales bacterium]